MLTKLCRAEEKCEILKDLEGSNIRRRRTARARLTSLLVSPAAVHRFAVSGAKSLAEKGNGPVGPLLAVASPNMATRTGASRRRQETCICSVFISSARRTLANIQSRFEITKRIEIRTRTGGSRLPRTWSRRKCIKRKKRFLRRDKRANEHLYLPEISIARARGCSERCDNLNDLHDFMLSKQCLFLVDT